MDWGELPEPDFASEMEIFVRSDAIHRYTLLADGDNTVEDVLVEIVGSNRAGRAPEPRLYSDGSELEKQKTLADCGINLDSVLHLKCTPRVLVHVYENRQEGGSAEAESGSSARSNKDGEMKIFVQSEYEGDYALEVDSSNTIQDVLAAVLPIGRLVADPEPELYFDGRLLERGKSLADYRIQDESMLHLWCTDWICHSANGIEMPNIISGRKRIVITDRPLVIWEKEHDKVLLGLYIEQIQNGGKDALHFEKDTWNDIVVKFNEATGLKYDNGNLYGRFNFYKCAYRIVSRIRHHPKFRWDHQRQVVIATDAEWNEYIKEDPEAMPYRRRALPYIDLLDIMFAEKKE